MKSAFLRFISFFDARDLFVLAGLVFLFIGIEQKVDRPTAMIVIGAIIVIKGLTKWV